MPDAKSSHSKGGYWPANLETREWFWLGDRKVVGDPEYSVKLLLKLFE
jgi:hypothetical protein